MEGGSREGRSSGGRSTVQAILKKMIFPQTLKIEKTNLTKLFLRHLAKCVNITLCFELVHFIHAQCALVVDSRS